MSIRAHFIYVSEKPVLGALINTVCGKELAFEEGSHKHLSEDKFCSMCLDWYADDEPLLEDDTFTGYILLEQLDEVIN